MGNEIEPVLDAIHTALLGGDIAAIGSLSQQLDAVSGTLRDCSGDMLQRIKTKAIRNEQALRAADQGVRSAQRRLRELQEAASGHRTYARDGHRAITAGQFSALQQRV